MFKKTVFYLIFCCMISISSLLFAESQASQPEKPAPASQPKPVINALLEEHPTVRSIAKLLPEFERQTGIIVNIEVIPFEAMTRKADSVLKSGSDRYDVFMDGWVNALGWASKGYLEPIDGLVAQKNLYSELNMSDFVEPFINDARQGENLYGLPVYGESTFLFYRKDLFAQAGLAPPKSMEEIREAAAVLKKHFPEIYPISLRGREGIHVVYAWSTFLWAFGGRWFDENGRLDLDSPQAVEATIFFTDLLRSYGPPGVANFGWEENRDLFMRGKVAISIDATVNGAFNENSNLSAVAGKVGYLSTPVKSGINARGGQNSLITHQMYLNKFSKNKEAAFSFMVWATSKQTQLAGIEIEPNCGLTSKSAIHSEVFAENFGAFKDAMLEAAAKGNRAYLPMVPEAKIIIEKVGRLLNSLIKNDQNAVQELKKVNDELNELLAK